MDFLGSVHAAVRDVIGDGDHPVVVFSSAWPFMREMRRTDSGAVGDLLDTLVDATGARSLLMPTFTGGFGAGVCDLDREISQTGVLSEAFRTRPGVRRTLSAFFSFAVSGPAADEVLDLAPADAWGDGSLYDWMERRDVRCLMFGTHPTHSSYHHRVEWLARDVVAYRFPKTFGGRVIREGREIGLTETLFVRRLAPEAVNDFTTLLPLLERIGMRTARVKGISIAAHDARPLIPLALDAVRRDPLVFVKNRSDFQV
jgi:aminoglycoside 3-N-acetyltransferase